MVLTIWIVYFWYSNWKYKYMKQKFLYIICSIVGMSLHAQQEFHVFPEQHSQTPGTIDGNGALTNPWDLQTALKQSSDSVKSGDTIWLHEGIYNGLFVSTLESLDTNGYITVSAFENDKVILNGNVNSKRQHILDVKGQRVIYKNFDITCLGEFSRNASDANFRRINGIEHASGEDCQFINIKVYNNPGLGIGSWKHTGGTKFDGCMVYNNGYIDKGKPYGEGIYTQNASNKTRVFENCIVFNNYYKGIEVWSANTRAKTAYVKNFVLKNNVIFNNGSPAGVFKDNLIIASGDRNGINIAQNIKVLNNIFYHNTNIKNRQVNGDAASLTLGFQKKAPIENVVVKNNIIIGRNNALRVLHARSLTFENNKAYCGYVHLETSALKYIDDWTFNNNTYYTKNNKGFRITGDKDYTFENWKSTYDLDGNSQWKHIKAFDMTSVANVIRYNHKESTFKVVLFEEGSKPVAVDFSKFGLNAEQHYKIYDAENPKVILKSGTLTENLKVTFPMELTNFEKPLHNSKAQKTLSNFGVFVIEFETVSSAVDETQEDRKGLFKRFFKWLGF